MRFLRVHNGVCLKKTAVTLSVDDVLKWFEAQGAESQNRINGPCESTLKRIRNKSGRASPSEIDSPSYPVQFVTQIRLAYDTCRKEA